MKSNLKLAFEIFYRMVICGVITFFIYIIVTTLFTFMFTKENQAVIYRLRDGEYVFSEIQTFEDKSSYKPPEGDDIRVQYQRGDLPRAADIVDGIIVETAALAILFNYFAAVLGKPGFRARKEGKRPFRGLAVGFIAAVPAFATCVAYTIASAARVGAARLVYLICNSVFIPLLQAVLSASGNQFSVATALCSGAVFLIIPAMAQLAYRFGQAYNEWDITSIMYKKAEKKESGK